MEMDGFLNLDKPSGWTSHDVVAKVRRVVSGAKVGHAGTLDPQATGVLPLCLGKATKLVDFVMNSPKEYRVRMRLGVTTDTQDAEGRVISREENLAVGRAAVEEALRAFVGPVRQVPPMYSAIKMKGQPLYKLARKGQTVERTARPVTIYSLDLLDFEGDAAIFDVVCSRGTYVRTLCADIGEKLGVGAICEGLQRRKCGPFRIEEAVALDDVLFALAGGDFHRILHGLDAVLGHLPELRIRPDRLSRVLNGVPIAFRDLECVPREFAAETLFRVTSPEKGVVALAKSDRHPEGVFKVEKVLVSAERHRDYHYSFVHKE